MVTTLDFDKALGEQAEQSQFTDEDLNAVTTQADKLDVRHNTMERALTETAAQQPRPTLEQLTLEVKFYLNQTAQNIIEVGKRLIQAKSMVEHGQWENWLEKNFSLKVRMAQNFMACAERFGKTHSNAHLNQTQMIAMLALPAEETEAFIKAKAAEGTPVEDMATRKLREEIEMWKSRAEVNENALKESQREAAQALQRVGKIAQEYNAVHDAKEVLQRKLEDATRSNADLRNRLRNQKPVIQAPADYEQTKRDVANLRNEKFNLQRKLEAAAREVKVPDDYHANKKRLAELDAKIAAMQKTIDAKDAELQRRVTAEEYYATAQKLDAISALVNDIIFKKELGAVVEEYHRNNRDRFEQILALFSDFVRSYKK